MAATEVLRSTLLKGAKIIATPVVDVQPIRGTTRFDDYTDEMFDKDIKKAGNKIDAMAKTALRNLKGGKARTFPE